jgi:hypothetical protein
MQEKIPITFCGQDVTKDQVEEIVEIVELFPKLSRTELANTVCELFSWKRPTGKLKAVECRDFLECLDGSGVIRLPASREQYRKKSRLTVQRTQQGRAQEDLWACLEELKPLFLSRVKTREQRSLWYEYIDRHHYLGYQQPFGAQLRYFIGSGRTGAQLGCFQFSSPAWAMEDRDRWIGWSQEQRSRNLQKVVNNSRFLIFPWVHVKNLASSALALAAKTVSDDWKSSYGLQPVLLETLVDTERFKGTCYRAANWRHIGKTTGRGRMDRENKRHGMAVKDIYVYPLTSRFRKELAAV